MTNAEKLAIKSQINNLKETIKNLESLLVDDTLPAKSGKTEYTFIKSMTKDEMTALANAIILKSGLEYTGNATKVSIAYAQVYNEGFEKPYLNRNKLEITIYNGDEVLIGGIFNKAKFSEFFAQLAYLGIFQYNKDHTANTAVLNC